MADPAEFLQPVRNAFYLGHFEECLKLALNLMKRNQALSYLPEVYILRCQIQQKLYDQVLKTSTTNPVIQTVKFLAQFKQSQMETRDMVVQALQEFIADETVLDDPMVKLIAGQIFLENGNLKEALKLVHDAETLELNSLCVLIYLAMNRLDLAGQQLKAMQAEDDDDTLTQLSSAWVYIAEGGDKVQEAYLILQELVEKHGPSVLISNSLAVCQLSLKKYSEAFELLKEAQELSTQNNLVVSSETLVNMVICLQLLNKGGEAIAKVSSELKALEPHHPWFLKNEAANLAIDSL